MTSGKWTVASEKRIMNRKNISILNRAREVLKIEAEAITEQISHIDKDFAESVQLIHNAVSNGKKIIVMGIGKSGLIGRKIAATLSSTGTPAIFFHPAEGLHGDLGMIQPGDVLLALSASGETEEIKKVLPLLKQKRLTLISMTCEKNSRLARSSDLVICAFVRKEACPLNLSPTASTTAMLALGDALAMSLMEHKGFKPEDFARLHPGGSLGKKLTMKVKDLMHTGTENPVVHITATVQEALLEMTRTRMGATHIVDGKGRLTGFFTDGDLRRQLQEDKRLLDRPLKNVMTKKPRTITPDKTIYEALQLIQSGGFDNLPVVDRQGRPIGILDERDLLAEGIV